VYELAGWYRGYGSGMEELEELQKFDFFFSSVDLRVSGGVKTWEAERSGQGEWA
jgi:hypothetical protein